MAGQARRQVLIYSGDMFNDLTGVPYVITMEVVDTPDPLTVTTIEGRHISYTRLDHTPKASLVDCLGEVTTGEIQTLNTRLFMVLTTS
ncbi:hypothetical protein FNH05_09070 [Amycolatopsis rhizosphaerae]|uniref:Type II toxin-antitoxin system PemK/MazF family toxin n=1 Tax=Amycolatopsis rhizosphaerae TaxID=2053003 RepID=A0A558D422_9PSEU|nr:hypothetical protein [Amycolatopsis rhizosphaerae]TVT55767.1 hypothetical protein FNH05_09070 [Amycolatopsis rhizosphaerae]